MNKLLASSIIAVIGFAGVTLAQEQQPQRPQPSTSETEGRAAERVVPGETPTQQAPQQTQDPRPATSPTEGTAADTTPPGRTPTTPGSTQRGTQTGEGTDLVGAAVVTPNNAPLGEVVEVVFAAESQQPEFVVITSEGKSMAVPYAVANSMMTGDKVVIDRARLQAAPKVKQGQWRDQASGSWKKESTRYWDQG